jgi:hypothetical protein
MAITKMYPAQVTMMTTHAQKRWIKEKSEAEVAAGRNVSESQVCRDLFDAGRRLEEHAAKSGWSVEQLLDVIETQVPVRG